MSSPFVRIIEKNDLRIVYCRADGSSVIYLGGQRNLGILDMETGSW